MSSRLSYSNFAIGTVTGTFTNVATTINLTAGHGNRFPTAPFRVTLYNSTDFTNPADAFWAGEAEIIEVGAKTSGTLDTLSRAQEGTTGIASTTDKIYKVICGLTNYDVSNIYDQSIYFNVKDYGALGDGIADDTTAIQDTITAAAVLGGIVFIPAGTYLVSTLTVANGVEIFGIGNKSILSATGTIAGHGVFEAVNKQDWSIDNLKIDGNSIGSTYCIEITGTGGNCERYRLSNLWLYNGGYRSLNIRSGVVAYLENIYIYGNAGDCAFLIGTNTDETFICHNIKVNNLIIKDVDIDGGGIWRQNSTGIVQNISINGLFVSETGNTGTGHGFFTHDVYDISISDFVIRDGQDSSGNGLHIDGGSRLVISNGVIKDYLLNGLTLSGVSPSNMSFNNIILHSNQRGVVIDGNTTTPCQYIQFNNCITHSNDYDGFWGAGSFVQWNNCTSHGNGLESGYYAGWMLQSALITGKPFNHQFSNCRAYSAGYNNQNYGINFGDYCDKIYIDDNSKFSGTAPGGNFYFSAAASMDDVFFSNDNYNVKNFGATGDGTTDDTPAIQAAITVAGAVGGEVFIPSGNYNIEGRLFYKSIYPLKIRGVGTSSALTWDPPAPVHKTVTAASNATPIVITATSHGFVTGDWIWIEGVTGNTAANGNWVITKTGDNTFSLDGSVGNGAWVSGGTATMHKDWAFLGITGTEKATAYHCTGVTISDLKIDFGSSRAIATDTYYRGINIFNTDNIIIERCYLKGCRAECIGLGNFGDLATIGSHAIIRDNYIYDCAQNAINPNVFDSIITGNKIIKCTQGVEPGRDRLTITDNYFEDILSYAIGISSVEGFVITGNRFLDCINDVTGLGSVVATIQIAGGGASAPSTNGTISNNVIINTTNHAWMAGINSTRGTSTTTPSKIRISENVIDGAMRGIYLNGLDDSLIHGNHINPRSGSVIGIEVANVVYNNNNVISDNHVPGTWGTTAILDGTTGQGNVRYENKTDAGIDDLNSIGGYRQTIEGWFQDNVAKSQAAVVLERNGKSITGGVFTAIRAGSITGIGVRFNDSVTAGTATVIARIAGTPTALSAILSSTNPLLKYTTAAKDTYAFTAGQALSITLTTDAGLLPDGTAELEAWLEIEC